MVMQELTHKEIQILKVFWKANRPLTAHEVLALKPEGTWSESGIHQYLNRLVERGVVFETGTFVRSGKTFARVFEVKISLADYYAELLAPVIDFIDIKLLVQKILDRYSE